MSLQIRIGTRDSQLALWQAGFVQDQLKALGHDPVLVPVKSEGDIDLQTPLYEMGVQGVFTRTLDAYLLSGKIDIAVHSMKDVPTQLARGIVQAAVPLRASYKDVLVPGKETDFLDDFSSEALIATSSIRRKAQWLNRYPQHRIENLRGNVNTRLRKLSESNWQGAIFARAGLERINLLPANAVELNWMLPAPAQGAIMIVCREGEEEMRKALQPLNDAHTALCTKAERDFLRILLGGCSTPISALGEIKDDIFHFTGNVIALDGSDKAEVSLQIPLHDIQALALAGKTAAEKLLAAGGQKIVEGIRNAGN